jgi:serine/threonine protein kinase
MKRRFSMKNKLYQFRQIVLAVAELKAKSGLCHLDLKLDNFVISEDWMIKIIDFCHASKPGVIINKQSGTPQYLAPEVAFSQQYQRYGYEPS